MSREVIGLVEEVVFVKDLEKTKIKARIDTGATKSSVDTSLAAKLQLGPIVQTKTVRSASGHSLRPMVQAKIIMAGQELHGLFTISNRAKMKYPVLIGRNLIEQGNFMIDPQK